MQASALQGIRVIDFGQYIAGPMAAMLLADQGADVIRIDPPGGPRYMVPGNATWNRGKRSIVLNLKIGGDAEIARKLIASADVVIENFRPGVMERLGLGHTAITQDHPSLIYCSLPGFGSDDPRARVRAWEGVIGAATAAYRPTSKSGTPVYTIIPYSSVFAAFLGAVSIAAALNARSQTGLGQRIEVPLYDATFTAIGYRGMVIHNAPMIRPDFNWSRTLPTKDGRWLQYQHNNKQFEGFIHEIGIAAYRDAGANPAELGKCFDDIFRQRTAQEWEEYCAAFGTEGVTCYTPAEWVRHPHALASKIIDHFTDPEIGPFRGPGFGFRMSATPGAVRSPRPKIDAHRDEILRELASLPPKPRAPQSELSAALHGIKVLDLCIVLAGPTCGRTLAEFGADVIKIDSPNRNPIILHNDINRAKRSLLLDLKTEEGMQILWKLIDTADVVLQNFRLGAAERLGLSYEAVHARRPDIIYCSMNAFGQIGPYAGRPGHEQLAQALTGMQMRYGGGKPAIAPYSANDYGTGLLGCYAVILALLHRRRTGHGQHVDSALAYAATMLQSGLLQDHAGQKWNEPSGQGLLGERPLYRAYQTGDGWLFLAATPEDLAQCAALSDLSSLSGSELERALEQRMRGRNVDQWVETLTQANIGVHRVALTFSEVMGDAIARSRGLSVTREHDEIGPVTTIGPAPRMSRTPIVIGRPAPKPGSDAVSVLAEIGMAEELERLVRDKVIAIDGINPDTGKRS